MYLEKNANKKAIATMPPAIVHLIQVTFELRTSDIVLKKTATFRFLCKRKTSPSGRRFSLVLLFIVLIAMI